MAVHKKEVIPTKSEKESEDIVKPFESPSAHKMNTDKRWMSNEACGKNGSCSQLFSSLSLRDIKQESIVCSAPVLEKGEVDKENVNCINELKVFADWQASCSNFVPDECVQEPCSSEEEVDVNDEAAEEIEKQEDREIDKRAAFVEEVDIRIDEYSEQLLLGLPEPYITRWKDYAKACLNIYLNEEKYFNYKVDLSNIALICIYAAARDKGYPFSVNELARFGAGNRKLEECKRMLKSILFRFNKNKVGVRNLSDPAEFIPRFVRQLDLPAIVISKACGLCKEWVNYNTSTRTFGSAVVAGSSIVVVTSETSEFRTVDINEVPNTFAMSKPSLKRMVDALYEFIRSHLDKHQITWEQLFEFL